MCLVKRMKNIFLMLLTILALPIIAFASESTPSEVMECRQMCCDYAEGTWEGDYCASPEEEQYYVECGMDCADAYNADVSYSGCCCSSLYMILLLGGVVIVDRRQKK